MFDKVILKNISSLFGIRVAGYIIPLITLPYLVRVLGVEGYGYLGFSVAIVQYFILVVNYGFDLSATSNIAKIPNNKKQISKIFWNILLIRTAAAAIGLATLIIASVFFSSLGNILSVILACYVSVVGAALFPQWLFQGKEQLGLISTARIILQFLTFPLLFVFVTKTNDIWQAALIGSLPSFLIAIVAVFIIIKREWIDWYKPSWLGIKHEIIDGWHIFISTASISLYTTSVTVVLGIVSGAISVGYFTAADRLIKAVLGVYGPISDAFYPRINAAVADSKEKAVILITKLCKLILSIAMCMSITLFCLSDWIIQLLFGSEFSTSADLLKILAFLPVVISLSNIFGIQTLISFGYKKVFSRILIVTGCLSLLLLIPLTIFFAEYGAAISVLVTEVIVTFSMWSAVNKLKILKLEK
ncbi:MAG: PST family polysaccharide transporter [Cognaticolwellia sp.]|jgi:PST family polysaccharide transporter